jgi:hypothetical protein
VAGFRRAVVFGVALIAAATAAGVVFGAQLVTNAKTAKAAAVPVRTQEPTAAVFADQFASAANARSAMIGDGGTIGHVSCVEGSRASYACSFVRSRPGRGSSCAILRWTQNPFSAFVVQRAGRVAPPPAECGPVTNVLHVLGTSG